MKQLKKMNSYKMKQLKSKHMKQLKSKNMKQRVNISDETKSRHIR